MEHCLINVLINRTFQRPLTEGFLVNSASTTLMAFTAESGQLAAEFALVSGMPIWYIRTFLVSLVSFLKVSPNFSLAISLAMVLTIWGAKRFLSSISNSEEE
jgi:hypothetical protein